MQSSLVETKTAAQLYCASEYAKDSWVVINSEDHPCSIKLLSINSKRGKSSKVNEMYNRSNTFWRQFFLHAFKFFFLLFLHIILK